MVRITHEEIKLLSPYIFSLSGIFIDQSKEYLLQSRLAPLLPKWGCNNFTDLYRKAVSDEKVKNAVIDAVTTNETFFFRDKTPFELLQFKILPELIDRKKRENRSARIPVKIWCTASSTGQEPYTIAMVIKEALPDQSAYDIQILGTDLSEEAYARASYGLFTQFEVKRGLPKAFLMKYFKPFRDGWRINDEIRILTRFEKFNLLHPFSRLGTFDIIFCRNVAIYFLNDEKVKLFRKIKKSLNPGGYLLVGGSESLSGVAPDFEMKRYLNSMYYQPAGSREIAPDTPEFTRQKIRPVKRKKSPAILNTAAAPAKGGESRKSGPPLHEKAPKSEMKPSEPIHKNMKEKTPFSTETETGKGNQTAIPGASLLSSLTKSPPPGKACINSRGQKEASGKSSLLEKIKKESCEKTSASRGKREN